MAGRWRPDIFWGEWSFQAEPIAMKERQVKVVSKNRSA